MFAPQKDTVISPGNPVMHEALFTFHGFRYNSCYRYGKCQKKEDFTAVLLSSLKENAGFFPVQMKN